MPFLRLTRDRHGYETTMLLHTVRPGERPRVLYLYRSAPAVRVGRKPLDEEAIRTIEEQHPGVDFDWLGLTESAGPIITEPERRPRRKKRGREDDASMGAGDLAEAGPDDSSEEPPPVMHAAEHAVLAASEPRRHEPRPETRTQPRQASGLLDQLVGREIAGRLRQRHAELAEAVATARDLADADTIRARVASIDPDAWATPDQILAGIQRADAEYEELKLEIGIG